MFNFSAPLFIGPFARAWQFSDKFSHAWYLPKHSGDQIPVGARFSAPVQTCPGAHPASYTTGTGSFPGVKPPGRSVDHSPHLVPRLRKEYSYTSTPSLGIWGLL
jgi:hypothetical protein